ncbi:Bmt5p [Sugiyamaella lignohabitans]|uniref:Bmt5p n=1 Tax=Sugiyamaella lignohabitans TaxID=796027 RepID=A0A167EGW1_9ASCO|nr:Bmt5p [Sugiyamaella lignohabitans]ANB14066.1 Bmt5p [Sugiyamaella lignohabitans]
MGRGRLAGALAKEQLKVKEAALREKAEERRKEKQKHVKAKASGIKKQKDVTSEETTMTTKRYWIPFERQNKVLLIGEGDYSFAYSMLRQDLVCFLTATSLDSEQQLLVKYPSTVRLHLDYLRESAKAETFFEIDGTMLEKSKPLRQNIGRYDMCVFNFPHLGNSIKDQDRNIRQHQELMLSFFKSARHMINPITGKILVTLFDGEPYSFWNIKQLARSAGYSLHRSGAFEWDAFPEYNHHLTSKEGHTSKPQRTRAARMYLFAIHHESLKKASKIKVKSKSQNEDDSD